jgi:anaerobic selenocysteine-containing dehydrogenase
MKTFKMMPIYLLLLLLLYSCAETPNLSTFVETDKVESKPVQEYKEMHRTSYKVNEPIYNETRELSLTKLKIHDSYEVPPVIALHPETAKELGVELGDKVKIQMSNGVIVTKIYADNMSDKGRFNKLNRNRIDFLINKDAKLVSGKVKVLIN